MNIFKALEAQASLDLSGWFSSTTKLATSLDAPAEKIIANFDRIQAQVEATDATFEAAARSQQKLWDAIDMHDADAKLTEQLALEQRVADERDAAINDQIIAEQRLEDERENNRQRFIRNAEAMESQADQQIADSRRVAEHEQRLQDIRNNRIAQERQIAMAAARGAQARISAMQREEMEMEALQIELQTIHEMQQKANGSLGKGSMFVMEFGRAVEDAAIGASFNGIRGAIVGASNNLARMAEMSGPLLGQFARFAPYVSLFVSLGTALYMVVGAMQDGEEATDNAAEALDKYIEKMERALELQQRSRDFIRELADADSSDEVERILEDRARSIEDMAADQAFWIAEEKRLRDERQSLVASIESERENRSLGERAGDIVFDSTLDILEKGLDEIDAQLAEAQQRALDAKEEMGRLDDESIDARSQLLEETKEETAEFYRQAELEEAKLERQREMLTLAQERAEVEARATRLSVDEEMQSILDPGGAAVDALLAGFTERQSAIDADDSIGSAMRESMSADNQAVFDQQMAELFDVERLGELSTVLADMALEGEIVNERYVELQNQLVTLEEQFNDGSISLDQFNNSVEHVEDSIRELEQAAEEAAEAEQRAALLRGDFEGAGLSMEEALEDRLAAERMRQWNEAVDDQFDSLMGVNDEFDEWQKQMEKYAKEQERAMDALSQFQGDPEESIGALWAFINSIEGQIRLTENEMALTQQTLDQLGDSLDTFRKMELEQHLDDLTSALTDLYDQLEKSRYFTEISGPAWFSDPGLQSPADNASTTRGVRGNGGIVMEFPNINKLTNSDVGRVSDQLMEENRRRGIRAF